MMDFDPFARPTVHLCVDMQRMFGGETEWHTPWFSKVLPKIELLAAAGPASTVFTRLIPVARADEARGDWRRYYRRWPMMTLQALAPEMVELVPELSRFAPPARIVDKTVYSPWLQTVLHESLARRDVGTIIVSGGGKPTSVSSGRCSARSTMASTSCWRKIASAAPPTRATTHPGRSIGSVMAPMCP